MTNKVGRPIKVRQGLVGTGMLKWSVRRCLPQVPEQKAKQKRQPREVPRTESEKHEVFNVGRKRTRWFVTFRREMLLKLSSQRTHGKAERRNWRLKYNIFAKVKYTVRQTHLENNHTKQMTRDKKMCYLISLNTHKVGDNNKKTIIAISLLYHVCTYNSNESSKASRVCGQNGAIKG